ncbi:MAG: CPBP family intramembrane glutamic endopeptidase [Patescibacteria group bacterium]
MSNASSESNPAAKKINVPWNPWLAVIFAVGVYFASQIIAGTLIALYPLQHHWSETQANDWLNSSVTAQFIYIMVTEALIVGAIYLFLRMYRLGWAAIGLKRPRLDDLLYGFAAVPFYFGFYLASLALATYLFPNLDINQQQELGFNNVHGLWPLAMTFISLVVLPPLVEEIMVRGFLYSSLKKALPTVGAVLVTSGIFAAAHLPEGGAAGPLYIAALDTFVLSLVLVYLREKTGSLWASITLHAIKNGVAFVMLFVLHIV